MSSQPAVVLLSNGSYGVMITSAGAGYSTWRDLDVTRWREDAPATGDGGWPWLQLGGQ